ncbi:CBS domain-containing protein [Blautia hydrogenotrophica]|uniref:CBS domain-containing protein n=1 Tax=Blautia hydrogenotrophica TaxID=53443 RepID=UPI002E7649E4|nr:CBS domain-containing protein [Blautia hydrogenotrophica]MEE0463525.1 CBS domain-containing protein [Blautia hydrogenotrophica]
MISEKLKGFIVEKSDSIIEALRKIDQNKKGFLIVIDNEETVIGTLTDGDIRRSFINGASVNNSISLVYTKAFKYLTLKDGMPGATEFFKNDSIKFLPVLDDEKKLLNIITKSQMHALLLQDIHADLTYDFFSLDEGIVDYEIFQRPWGFYKTTVMNDYFQSKVISVNPKSQLSLQSHNHREEHWIVAHGFGTVQLDQSVIEVKCGSSIFIPKGCKHRLTNTDDTESLIITEVQIGDYFGEDDIKRYEDIYGRV